MIYALNRKTCKGMKKMPMNRIENLMIVILQVNEM
jgi:hypothetical protein